MTEAQETLRLELAKLRSLLVNLPDPHPITDSKACYCIANTISSLLNEFELALDQGDNGQEDTLDDMRGLGAAYEGEWEAQILEQRKGHAQAPPTRSGHWGGPRR